MATRIINIDRNTSLLSPPDLCDWVADDDMVHFVIEAVAEYGSGMEPAIEFVV